MQSDPAAIVRATMGALPGSAAVGLWRGDAAVHGQTPTAPDAPAALFEIGSVSKVFTGLLLAQAVERGELSPDDTLGKLLGGEIKLTPHVAGITLRQLVTHSSCLPRLPDNLVVEDGSGNPYRHYDRAALWNALSGLTLPQAPPCTGEYSNMGFAVLGELLARRYNMSWDALVRERITGPLGMDDTLQHAGGKAARLARPHFGSRAVSQWDFKAFAGGGGLHSTAADMLVFSKAVLAGRNGPLGAAAERLLQPLGKFQGGEIGYAVMMTGPEQRRTYFHGGATGGFRSSWALFPDKGEALVVLAGNGEARADAAFGDITKARYGIRASNIEVAVSALPAYAGVYRLNGKQAFTFVVQDGQLYGRMTGQLFSPLTAAAPDVFTIPAAGAEFTFARSPDSGGKVVAVALRQRGALMEAKRTSEAPPALARHAHITHETYGGMFVAPQPPLNFDIKERSGQLLLQLNEQPAVAVFPMDGKADRFASDLVAAEVQFERDAGGKVTALVLHQNGQAIRAVRQAAAAP